MFIGRDDLRAILAELCAGSIPIELESKICGALTEYISCGSIEVCGGGTGVATFWASIGGTQHGLEVVRPGSLADRCEKIEAADDGVYADE